MVVVVLATHVQAAIINKPSVVISMGLLMRGTADSGFVLCNHRTVVNNRTGGRQKSPAMAD
jgi:hypothetical protein